MLTPTLPCSIWHYKMFKSYYPNYPLSSPTLLKSNGLILNPIASFFSESFTRIRVCFTSDRYSFVYCASMSLFMWRSRDKHLVNNLSYNTNISFIISSFFTSLHTCLNFLHLPTFHGVSVVIPLIIQVPISFGALFGMDVQQPTTHFEIFFQLLFWRMEHMFKRRTPTFSIATPNNKWISLSPKTASEL